MSAIDNLNRFVKNPTNIDISRSRFKRPFTHKTTFKSGKLIPFFVDEVLPGDTFDVSWSSVIRMLTPAVPVLDNAFFDLYFFFVPNRLCTYGKDDWQKIQGENTSGYWAPSTEATLQNTSNTFTLNSRSIISGSVANYLGLPIGSFGSGYSSLPISLLPFNAYIKIWNEWFRDQNTQAPKSLLYAGAGDISTYLTDCLDVNKLHDYFTSSLPAPQKGGSVLLPLAGTAPIKTATTDMFTGTNKTPIKFRDAVSGNYPSTSVGVAISGSNTSQGVLSEVSTGGGAGPSIIEGGYYPSNLYADLATATAASVNEMRQAFAIQRLLEKDARGGTRYREMLKAHFGVTIPDLTIQVPEYLGGKRIPLNITQVLQTSETTNNSPLGATGAFSNTSYSDKAFIKSFNEYGFIIGVGCVRTEQSYSQGIPKMFTRNRRYDHYLPVFANLGEQAILKRELFVDQYATGLTAVFGYQEAWAEYRYHPNLVTGNLAPNANDTTLTAWTYTNKFTAQPTLNSTFMVQPSSQIGDTLVVTNTNTQFVADFYFDIKATRPMPMYSIPGLIDHH